MIFFQKINDQFLTPSPRFQILPGSDSELWVWDLSTWTPLLSLPAERWNSTIAFSHDDRWLSYGNETSDVIDPRTGEVRFGYEGHTLPQSPTWAPDDSLLVSTDWGGGVAFVDGASGYVLHREQIHELSASAPLFLPDGRVLTWGSAGEIALWQTSSQIERVLPIPAAIGSPVWMERDGMIAVQTNAARMELWDPVTWELRSTLEGPAGTESRGFSYTGGDLGAVSWSDGSIVVFERDGDDWRPRFTHRLGGGAAGGTVIREDEGWMTYGTDRETAVVLDLEGRELARVGTADRAVAPRHRVSDGRWLFGNSGHGSVSLCAMPAADCEVRELDDPLGWSAQLPGTDHVVRQSGNDIVLYDIVTGATRAWSDAEGRTWDRLRGHSRRMLGLDVTSDGRLALTGSTDHTGRLWDLERGVQITKFRSERGWVQPVNLLRDGRMALHGTAEGVIEIRELPTGRIVQTLDGIVVGLSSAHGNTVEDRLLLAHEGVGVLVLKLIDTPLGEVFEQTGRDTNLRVCRGSRAVVPVTPWPEPDSVWAPPGLCATEPSQNPGDPADG